MKALSFPLPIGVVIVAFGSAAGAYWAAPTWTFDPMTKRPTLELRNQANGVYDVLEKADLSVALTEWQSRPLFAEKRKVSTLGEAAKGMPESLQISVAEDIQTPDYIRFIGYIAKDGDKSGLFRNEQTGEETWVAVGEELGDWALAELSQVRAKFSHQGTFFSVDLFP